MPNNNEALVAIAFEVSQRLSSGAQRKHWSARLRGRSYSNVELEYIINSLKRQQLMERAEAETPAPQLTLGGAIK